MRCAGDVQLALGIVGQPDAYRIADLSVDLQAKLLRAIQQRTIEPVGSTDHLSFIDAGVPGFNPIQDYANYDVRTHHTNMDTVDRVQREDMIQQATVVAVFAYDAAMRDEKLPRKALPAAVESEFSAGCSRSPRLGHQPSSASHIWRSRSAVQMRGCWCSVASS